MPGAGYRCGADEGGAPVPSVSVPSPKRSCQPATGTVSFAVAEKLTASGASPWGGCGESVSSTTRALLSGLGAAHGGAVAASGRTQERKAAALCGLVPRSYGEPGRAS